jgi:hypothetical protein
MLAIDKRSSLFRRIKNYDEKKFYDIFCSKSSAPFAIEVSILQNFFYSQLMLL